MERMTEADAQKRYTHKRPEPDTAPPTTRAGPCGKMARWSLYTLDTNRPVYLCPRHMHILANAWEADVDKIVLERAGNHTCDYLGEDLANDVAPHLRKRIIEQDARIAFLASRNEMAKELLELLQVDLDVAIQQRVVLPEGENPPLTPKEETQ